MVYRITGSTYTWIYMVLLVTRYIRMTFFADFYYIYLNRTWKSIRDLHEMIRYEHCSTVQQGAHLFISDNVAAIQCYRKAGFEVVDEYDECLIKNY